MKREKRLTKFTTHIMNPAEINVSETSPSVKRIKKIPEITQSVLARFQSKINKEGKTPTHRPELGSCWIWTAGITKNGYPQFYIAGKNYLGHRVSWLIETGKNPEPLVLHKCDNKKCVRHSHHFLGSSADNSSDMVSKGRSAKGFKSGKYTQPESTKRGENHGNAKLKPDDIAEIVRLYESGISMEKIASMRSVESTIIGRILHGESWSHIPRRIFEKKKKNVSARCQGNQVQSIWFVRI